MRDRVARIVRDVFASPDLEMQDHLSPREIPQWDSLKHLDLVIALETEFGIRLQAEEIAEIEDIRTLFSVLARYGVS